MSKFDPLDILFVGAVRPSIDGDAVCGTELINILAQRGHRVRAVAPRSQSAGDDDLANDAELHPGVLLERLRSDAIELIYAPSWLIYEACQAEIEATLRRLITVRQPDVLMVGSPRCAAGVGEIAERVGIPWLCWAHGEFETADIDGFDSTIRDRISTEVITADRVVSCARHHGEWLARRGFTRITTIPNGIDVANFAPAPKNLELLAQMSLNSDQIVIGHISRLDENKRPRDIIRSAANVARSEPRIRYVIVGGRAQIPALREDCRRNAVDDKFRFIEWQDYSRIPDLVRLADIMVMPSSIECMNRVYLETQASGRVLLASDIVAAREVVVDDRTGVLFRAGDIADLTAKIVSLARDAKRRERIGKSARAYAESAHDIQSTATRFEYVLAEIAENRKRDPAIAHASA
ncbi:MAG: glycosyltransferase family 4 protein [Alphaproteobacteria bacterium]|nr:glycosyltransferase family 4 protein [Alphaproteobacteria bacterium]